MLAYTYIKQGTFALMEKPKPTLLDDRDAIVRVTLSSICTSDLHIKHGSVPRAVPGITVGHEMVGVVEEVPCPTTRSSYSKSSNETEHAISVSRFATSRSGWHGPFEPQRIAPSGTIISTGELLYY